MACSRSGRIFPPPLDERGLIRCPRPATHPRRGSMRLIGGRDVPVRARQPQPYPAWLDQRAAPLGDHLSAPGPEPPVPVTDAVPLLPDDTQSDRRAVPRSGHDERCAAPSRGGLQAPPGLGRGTPGRSQEHHLTGIQHGRGHLCPLRARLWDEYHPARSTPASVAASTPRSGTPATAHHMPCWDAAAISARQSKPGRWIATTEPLARPPPGSRGARAPSTGSAALTGCSSSPAATPSTGVTRGRPPPAGTFPFPAAGNGR